MVHICENLSHLSHSESVFLFLWDDMAKFVLLKQMLLCCEIEDQNMPDILFFC